MSVKENQKELLTLVREMSAQSPSFCERKSRKKDTVAPKSNAMNFMTCSKRFFMFPELKPKNDLSNAKLRQVLIL